MVRRSLVGLGKPKDDLTARRAAATGVAEDDLRRVGAALTTVPPAFTVHKTLARILDAKRAAIDTGDGLDWATAEALAFGTLLEDGFGVRLSGQDSGRGTFSQRHAVWVDQVDGSKYTPLKSIDAKFEVLDSPLSEFGVLGFEYGYSLADPRTPGAVGRPVRRLRQRRAGDDRPVHRGGRGEVAAGDGPCHAAATRLRGAGAGA